MTIHPARTKVIHGQTLNIKINMTKLEWKKQNGAARREQSKLDKWAMFADFGGKKQMEKTVKAIQDFGFKFLEQVKSECGLSEQNETERDQLAREEQNEIDDEATKAAGIA